MSFQLIPFVPTSTPDDSQPTTLRGLKVILLLVGLALCLQILETTPEWSAVLALGEPIDQIVLHPAANIRLHSEMVFPQIHMFTSPGFQKITGDRHVWAYMQAVDVGELSGLVYYFKFRDPIDARVCVEGIRSSSDFTVPREARQLDRYAVLAIVTHDSRDPAPFYEAVFAQLERNLQRPQ